MKNSTLVTIWYCSPVSVNDGGEVLQHFVNLRSTKTNIQTDRSELDIQSFGEYVDEIAKLRFTKLPEIQKGDAIYLRRLLLLGHLKKKVNRSLTMGRGITAFCRFSLRLLERTPFGTQPRLLSALKRGEPCLRSK